MAGNNKKSYLSYFNKLVDECKNTYHHSIINLDYSALSEKIETDSKLP